MRIIRNTMLFIFQIEMLSFSFISRDYISLQAPCQIFVDPPAWLESSIPSSLASDVQIHFIYLMCHTALLLLIFITFRVLDKIMSYGQSKRVIQANTFDDSKFWEGRTVDISISSRKIKILPYPGAIYLCKHFVRFSLIALPDLNPRFLVPLYLMFRLTLYKASHVKCSTGESHN
jgi:hypothetical protein